ncbi:hypothetical protein FQZ97_1091640 [compost metagenome]
MPGPTGWVESKLGLGTGAPPRPSALSLSATFMLPSLLRGAAAWAMSSRNAWPVRIAAAVLRGAAGLPSARPAAVTIWTNPFGPRSKRPYSSVASSGRLVTSASDRSMPSFSRACCLMSAQVARPPLAPSSMRPVATGTSTG